MKNLLTPELRWLVRQAWPLRPLYSAQLSLVFLSSLIGLVEPLLLKWIIDDIIPWRQSDMLWLAAILFFGALAFQYSFNALSFVIDTYVNERLTFKIRLALLRHLQTQSAEYYDRTPTGEVLHRLENDIDQIREFGGSKVAALLRIALMSSLTIVIMMFLSWQLTLIILPLLPLMLKMRSLAYPRLRRAADNTQQTSAGRLGMLQDHLRSMAQVQLLNRTAGERRRFTGFARRALEARVRHRSTEAFLELSTNLSFVLATAIVLGFGGAQVLGGALTVGGLVAFYTYLSRIFGPTQMLVSLYSGLQRASASIRRVREVLEVETTIVDPPEPVTLARSGSLAIELSDVHFAYRGERPVLRGLDLEIEAGEKVALVGASGCGKSTVARLLTRLYDPDRGCLALDGVDLRKFSLRTLRSRVALVPQDPILFDVGLKENLLYARADASDEEVREVLAMTQLEETVAELPNGWDEVVGHRGGRLSGGQRQRLAVARAILQSPRLLLLDEATSALDSITELRLLRALDRFVEQRTTLVIAHRLSAIRWADRIVVLDAGRVLADGDHRTLYGRCGIYRELCDKQAEGERSPATTALSESSEPSLLQRLA